MNCQYLVQKKKKIISLSGCIKGAIAFGIAMTIETGDINKNSVLLSTTLIIVLITTILFGPFIPHLLKKGEDESSKDLYEGLIENDNLSENQKIKFEHPNNEYLSKVNFKIKFSRFCLCVFLTIYLFLLFYVRINSLKAQK